MDHTGLVLITNNKIYQLSLTNRTTKNAPKVHYLLEYLIITNTLTVEPSL